MLFTAEQLRAYCDNNCCPVCQITTDIECVNSFEFIPNTDGGFTEMECNRCGTRWEERFCLTSCVITSFGTPPPGAAAVTTFED